MPNPNPQHKTQVLHRFIGGWSMDYIVFDNPRSHQYDDSNLDRCLKDANEGCIVVDKAECGDRAASFIMNGPSLDLTLAPGTIERFDAYEALADRLPSMSPVEKKMSSYALKSREWAGFDCMSLDMYLDAWRLLDAHIGVVTDGKVIWEASLVSAKI